MIFAGKLKVGDRIRWGATARRIIALDDADDDQAIVITFASGEPARLSKSDPIEVVTHKPWTKEQAANYPHLGGCEACRAEALCNACGAGLEENERCTNGRCRRCHAAVCTSNHGYGRPSGETGRSAP